MKYHRIFLFLLLVCFYVNTFSQYITVNHNRSAVDLVNNVLINSPCAAISNISVSGGNFGINDNSFGYFNADGTSFAFNDGIIISTGKVKSAVGPNVSLLSDTVSGWSGDDDLTTALNISRTFDATILEFDFVPLTNNVSFEYLLASEQYLSNPSANQCQFTDGFAFLIREVGTLSYQNIALVPGTTLPVAINTIRGATTNCQGANEQFFGGFNATNHPTNFNGQTVVLKAQTNLFSGKKYHIKLVVADQGNSQYDSAIFLGGGSFKVGVDLGNDQIVLNKNAICVGETKILDATQAGNNTYKWFKNGIDTNITTPTYNITDNSNTAEVLYEVEVGLGLSTCVAKGKVKIQFTKKPILKNVTITECDDDFDGKFKFNLTQLDDFIRSDFENIPLLNTTNIVKYFSDFNATIPIPNPSIYQNINANNESIYAQVTNNSGCSSIATINLKILNNSIPDLTINICDNDSLQDGLTTTNFNIIVTPALLPFIPTNATVKYYLSKENALLQTNSILNLFANTIPNQQILYGRIFNNIDCIGIVKIILNVFKFDKALFQDEIKFICPNKTIKLEVPSGFSYEWSNGNVSNNFINVSISDIYTVKIINSNNCSITKKFNVQNADLANIISIEINDFADNNTVLVNYSGIGNYEFSLDGVNFQNSSLFENVAFGDYTITIRDKNECNDVISKVFSVLDFPKFFTPNNDGFNDFWKIDKIDKNSTVAIYDRLGKTLFQFDNNSNGWNGTFNQQLLPADDYWFVLNFENNRIIKNHFALKR